VALLLAPPAHAFGPVSVKLEDIVVSRVDCAGEAAHAYTLCDSQLTCGRRSKPRLLVYWRTEKAVQWLHL
jgi:hypothetical protein